MQSKKPANQAKAQPAGLILDHFKSFLKFFNPYIPEGNNRTMSQKPDMSFFPL